MVVFVAWRKGMPPSPPKPVVEYHSLSAMTWGSPTKWSAPFRAVGILASHQTVWSGCTFKKHERHIELILCNYHVKCKTQVIQVYSSGLSKLLVVAVLNWTDEWLCDKTTTHQPNTSTGDPIAIPTPLCLVVRHFLERRFWRAFGVVRWEGIFYGEVILIRQSAKWDIHDIHW
jgi:hypothetical protein